MTDTPPDHLTSEFHSFLRGALELEGEIYGGGVKVREQSKLAYGDPLLDGRLAMMGVLNALLGLTPADGLEPGPEKSEALGLIAAFAQGTFATETLISEGQYIKAAAALKQDLEILARLGEIREGARHQGAKHVPNVKFAPTGAGRIYGELNAVAHISKPDLINQLLDRRAVDEDRAAIGPFPTFLAEVAVELYTLHVWLLSEVCRELLRLLEPVWNEGTHTSAELAMKFWLATVEKLLGDGVFVSAV